jgi:hypothetical protein
LAKNSNDVINTVGSKQLMAKKQKPESGCRTAKKIVDALGEIVMKLLTELIRN